MMKVLYAAAEGNPFVKTGGLADVIGALPKALRKLGADVRVVLPLYAAVPESYRSRMKLTAELEVPVGWRMKYCGIWELALEGVTYYFLDNEDYFKREGLYGYGDDGERFAYFGRAALEMIRHIDFVPDIIHSHDWHAGMVGALLEKHYRHDERYRAIRTVFTIHNLQYQGVFPYEVLGDLLGLDHEHFASGQVEYHGCVNYLKAGLVFSDRVTTVSHSYAEEIRSPEYGHGLDGELRFLGSKLSGILNGIDEKLYNPAKDPHLFVNYRTNMAKKAMNKLALQRTLGLPEREEVPMIGMVSRMTAQKGFDLVEDGLPSLLMQDDVQVVILGAGDHHYERLLSDYAARWPNQLSVQLKFDEGLARRIYAGSDLFLMPSRFEPCGISQMLAMRYGALPIVRETGGLKDTVIPYNEYTGEGNGFSFGPHSTQDMLHIVRLALAYYTLPEHWKQIAKNAFAGDYSWKQSAVRYMELYRSLTDAAFAAEVAAAAASEGEVPAVSVATSAVAAAAEEQIV